MRTKLSLRPALSAGALAFAIGTPAVALATGTSKAQGATPTNKPTASRPVAVAATFDVRRASVNVLSGSQVVVRGRLLPGVAWRRVLLQAHQGHGWQTIARAYTHRAGRFELRFVAANLGSEHLRVRFTGDEHSHRTWAYSGVLTVYRQSVASWYNDAGSTACGFHATYGVANKTLPCGTHVTFVYGGRQVTATVDDRGPFVAGRDWDFNQNTAAALGMGGVASVWSSI